MNRLVFLLFFAFMVSAAPGAHAEDIDLFTGQGSTSTAAPNLLFVMDNSGSFNASATESCVIDGVATALSGKAGGIEQCALYAAINGLPVSDTASVNIGIMVFSGSAKKATGAACPGSGGCLVYPLTGLTTTTKPILLAWIKRWEMSGSEIQSSNTLTATSLWEAWSYFSAGTGPSGTTYTGTLAAPTGCKNFLVFIGNSFTNSGGPQDQSGVKAALESIATPAQRVQITSPTGQMVNVCGTSNFPGTNNHEQSGFYADEWSRFMRASSFKVRTYTIGLINPDPKNCKPDYPWLLDSMADYGQGNYFQTSNFAQLKAALDTIFSEVRSVNSVFAAVSLPVSVNTQGTYLNQVFIGMFRPDEMGLPRWLGNLKQYKMGFLNGRLRMLDATGAAAISSAGSEFISECARSFWTPSATTAGDGYFSTYTDPNCTGYPASSNSPDGNLVEKGGQAYMLRKSSEANRVVKTCSATVSSCQTSLTDFTTGNAASINLGSTVTTSSTPTKNTLISWARGQNNSSNPEVAVLDGASITSTQMRPSVHGDVVHSRPAALNLGTDASPKIVVFYGANDGMFRAINGNRTASFTVGTTTVAPGDEFWSFMPPEFWSKIKRRYDNSVGLSTANPKDYAVDGPVTAYKDSNGDAWIYAGMRRGGRALYAFKMDKTTMAMSLQWKRGCGDDTTTNCDSSGLYNDIGQTWAPPQVFTTQGYASGSTLKPLLLMGGGYNPGCEDPVSYSCASTTGNKLYVIDAATGVRQKVFDTQRGVIADVTIVPDSTGSAAYIYAADLGGNIYRISGPLVGNVYQPIGSNSFSNWVITTVATLGCASGTTCTSPPNRKFMFPPEVVVDGSDYILLIGSGDREKPTNSSNATSNYFFKVVDRPDLGSAYLADTTNCGTGAASLCLSSLLSLAKGATPTTAQLASKKGWYLVLDSTEQVVTSALSLSGTVYFTTHTPPPVSTTTTTCSINLGRLRNYAIAYTNASGSDNAVVRDDGGLAPDPVAGKVTLDDGSTVAFCIGCLQPLEASQPPTATAVSNRAKIRSYWFLQK